MRSKVPGFRWAHPAHARFVAGLLCAGLFSAEAVLAQQNCTKRDNVYWDSVKTCTDAGDVKSYLRVFSEGCYVEAARDCLERLDVARPVSVCASHEAANRLVGAVGGSAASCYREVLSKDPGNRHANEGLQRIFETYVQRGREALERGDTVAAREHARILDSLKRGSPGVVELQNAIEATERKRRRAVLKINTVQDNASISVSNVPYAEGIKFDPGVYRLVVKAIGYETIQTKLDLVIGTNRFKVNLCRLKPQTKYVCEQKKFEETRGEWKEKTKTILKHDKYIYSGAERFEIHGGMQSFGKDKMFRILESAYCGTSTEWGPSVNRIIIELNEKCDHYNGETEKGTLDIDCECSFMGCKAEGSVDCIYSERVRVPVIRTRRVCRNEPYTEKICPNQAITRLQ